MVYIMYIMYMYIVCHGVHGASLPGPLYNGGSSGTAQGRDSSFVLLNNSIRPRPAVPPAATSQAAMTHLLHLMHPSVHCGWVGPHPASSSRSLRRFRTCRVLAAPQNFNLGAAEGEYVLAMVELQAVGYAVASPAQAPASGALPSANWARACPGGPCAANLSSVFGSYSGSQCVDVSTLCRLLSCRQVEGTAGWLHCARTAHVLHT